IPGASLKMLLRTRFTISPQSNRMGYRLSGAAVPAGGGGRVSGASLGGGVQFQCGGGEIVSDATFAGAIQCPPSGEPILLMADRQTTGGYPQAATVITADFPLAGQLAPGDWIEFALCTRLEAITALTEQAEAFRAG